MTLLSLTTDELREQIESEISTNPAPELVEERRCGTCHRLIPEHGVCPVCSLPSNPESEEPVVFLSPRDEFIPKKDYIDEGMDDEPYAAAGEELPTYVLRQIAPDLKEGQRGIAAFLLTHLDADGLLTTSLMEVARYLHVSLAEVEQVKKLIQRADPLGVGSATPQEALLAQLEVLAKR
jgi:RNA polymerase sigma-54 factor